MSFKGSKFWEGIMPLTQIMFGKFIGCKDLQESPIYRYGISKVNSTIIGSSACR